MTTTSKNFHRQIKLMDGRRGVVAAIQNGDQVHYGVSLCSRNDAFNKEKGIKIAEGRALKRPFLSMKLEEPEYNNRDFKTVAPVVAESFAQFNRYAH